MGECEEVQLKRRRRFPHAGFARLLVGHRYVVKIFIVQLVEFELFDLIFERLLQRERRAAATIEVSSFLKATRLRTDSSST
jgi:hypothetical protein